MAIILSDLILDVRAGISDLPEEYIDDPQIWKELRAAQTFITQIKKTSVPEIVESFCIVLLAQYYTYLNYTSIAERQMGSQPATSLIRLTAMKEKAYSFLQLISAYPLTPDITINTEKFNVPAYEFEVSSSLLEDNT